VSSFEAERAAIEGVGLEAIHVDAELVVLTKPSGLVVHPGSSGDELDATLVGRLRKAGIGAIHTVHRLDRGTSGVLVFARDPESARRLSEAFAEGRVHKRYLALVRGLAPDEAEIDHAIPKNEGGPKVPAPKHDAAPRDDRARGLALCARRATPGSRCDPRRVVSTKCVGT
jgi:23S rRNA-/tRNA-specific pseudouridylate synthase